MTIDTKNFPKDKHPLIKAILKVGSMRRFANNLNISHETVRAWLHRDEYQLVPPAKHCQAIENMTFGEVTKKELRPDIFDRGDTKKFTKEERLNDALMVIECAIKELIKGQEKKKKGA